jgi:hypothetical protein
MNLQRIESKLNPTKKYGLLLFSFLMFNSIKDMYKAANWSGKGFVSRQNLMEKLQSKTKFKFYFLLIKTSLNRIPSS